MLAGLMTAVARKIRSKFYASVAMMACGLLIFATKFVIAFLMMKNLVVPTLTDAEIEKYKNYGIYINT